MFDQSLGVEGAGGPCLSGDQGGGGRGCKGAGEGGRGGLEIAATPRFAASSEYNNKKTFQIDFVT